MIKINENFLELQESYLFATIAKKVAEFTKENPDKKVIKLGFSLLYFPLLPVITFVSKYTGYTGSVIATF